jgi:hypothetical protein
MKRVISLCLGAEVRAAIEEIAAEEERSRSQTVERLIRAALVARQSAATTDQENRST